jgi:hypothetical protein
MDLVCLNKDCPRYDQLLPEGVWKCPDCGGESVGTPTVKISVSMPRDWVPPQSQFREEEPRQELNKKDTTEMRRALRRVSKAEAREKVIEAETQAKIDREEAKTRARVLKFEAKTEHAINKEALKLLRRQRRQQSWRQFKARMTARRLRWKERFQGMWEYDGCNRTARNARAGQAAVVDAVYAVPLAAHDGSDVGVYPPGVSSQRGSRLVYPKTATDTG